MPHNAQEDVQHVIAHNTHYVRLAVVLVCSSMPSKGRNINVWRGMYDNQCRCDSY